MARYKAIFKGVSVLFIFFSLIITIVPHFSKADSLTQGPASVSGNPVLGQTLAVNVTFNAPNGSNPTGYMLDTEVFSEATRAKVAQFSEAFTLNAGQSINRSYNWQTAGLTPGKYIVKQGLFSMDWKTLLSWNDGSATINLVALSVVTPATAWQTGGKLVSTNPVVNSNLQLAGTFGVAVSGSYILDMELYNSENIKAYQYYETRNLTAGATQTVTWNMTPTVAGPYQLKVGIFTPDWQQKAWNNAVVSFNVLASTSSTVAPTQVNPSVPVNSQGFMRGVNLAGAEFSSEKIPGVYGVDYTYPTTAELDYFNSKGLKLIRLPFLWERVQPALWGDLNQTELARIDRVVAEAKARNMQIILDPHNYDRYTLNGNSYLIGSSQVPVAAFQDFWTRFATHYKAETAIYAFGLMNEPHDTNNTWAGTAQAGLNAIRAVDTNHLVLVPGDGWSGAWSWQQNNANLLLSDPANKLLYEAHQYFDRDNSGTYTESYDASGAYPNIGVDRVQPFINWLKVHNVRGIITEYGVPNNDPRWQTVLDNFLAKLDAEGIGGTYWAAGPWWGSYPLSVEPQNGQDKPVMSVLTRHPGK